MTSEYQLSADEKARRVWGSYYHVTRLVYDLRDEIQYMCDTLKWNSSVAVHLLRILTEFDVELSDAEQELNKLYPQKPLFNSKGKKP